MGGRSAFVSFGKDAKMNDVSWNHQRQIKFGRNTNMCTIIGETKPSMFATIPSTLSLVRGFYANIEAARRKN